MSQIFRFVLSAFSCVLFAAGIAVSAQDVGDAGISSLNGVKIPAGAVRLRDEDVPAEIGQTLTKLVALGGDRLRKGDSEVLVWAGKDYKRSNAPQLVRKFAENLQRGGWTYAVNEQNQDFTVFNSLSGSERRGVIGFWAASDDSLLVAWSEMLPADPPGVNPAMAPSKTAGTISESGSGTVLRVGKDDGHVNVMGNEMPAMPQFPAVKPRPGFVRGYVKDWTGKPLAGATIGVRASYFAGHYSGSQGRTDAKGYYEFAVPKGSAHFYNAGYAMEWAGGLAGVSLHPADGQIDSWVTSDGAVENFVLLPYGITSRASAQDNPRNSGSYYGGSVYISYGAYEASDNRPYAGYVPEDSTIEITLASSAGQTFVIQKKAGFQGLFRINNIPLGRYKISAKVNGKPLEMKQGGIVDQAFGISPRKTRGQAELVFAPDSARSESVSPQDGSWKAVEISLALR